jgi:hypothetical protein
MQVKVTFFKFRSEIINLEIFVRLKTTLKKVREKYEKIHNTL